LDFLADSDDPLRSNPDAAADKARIKAMEKERQKHIQQIQPIVQVWSDQYPQAGERTSFSFPFATECCVSPADFPVFEAGTFYIKFDNSNSYWSTKKVNFGYRLADPHELSSLHPLRPDHAIPKH